MFHLATVWSLFLLSFHSSAVVVAPFSQMCYDLQHGRRFVLVAGLLSTRLVLITTHSETGVDYFLHVLAPEALDANAMKIYVNVGSELRTTWPLLYEIFQKYRFDPHRLITLQIGQSGCVYLPNPNNGLAYDIDRRTVANFSGIKTIHMQWISAVEPLHFYGIEVLAAQQKAITKYQFSIIDSAGTYRITRNSPTYYLCEEVEDHLTLVTEGCMRTVIWNIDNGFADATQFYLFDGSNVRIFPLTAFNGQAVAVTTLPLDSFINCKGRPNVPSPQVNTPHQLLPFSAQPNNNSATGNLPPFTANTRAPSSHHSTALIFVAIFLIIFFVCMPATVICLLLCCARNSPKVVPGRPPDSQSVGAPMASEQSQALPGPLHPLPSLKKAKKKKITAAKKKNTSKRSSKTKQMKRSTKGRKRRSKENSKKTSSSATRRQVSAQSSRKSKKKKKRSRRRTGGSSVSRTRRQSTSKSRNNSKASAIYGSRGGGSSSSHRSSSRQRSSSRK